MKLSPACVYIERLWHARGHGQYSHISVNKSKKDSKYQESIQSGTTPVPGYQMGK